MGYKKSGVLSMLRKGTRIKVIGDSIAAGGGSSDGLKSDEIVLKTNEKVFLRRKGRNSWIGLFEEYINDKFPNCSVVNNGCGGITSSEVRENLEKLYSNEDEIIIIFLGANDRKQENGMNILFDNLTYMVRFFKEKDKKVILMSTTPSTAYNEAYPNRLFHNEDVNNVVACVAENEEVQLINNYNYIQEYLLYTGKTIEEIMTEENCNSDGLHPTDKVHYLIFRNLIQSLNLGIKIEGASW